MQIELTVKSKAYRYLWLKYVTGFDPSVHCARCLLGRYAPLLPFRADRQIPAGLHAQAELEPEAAPYLYLCGVTAHYAENLHIAFEADPESAITYEDGHIHVHITQARQVPICPVPASVIQAQRLSKPFYTCRNFQFGWNTFRPQDAPLSVPKPASLGAVQGGDPAGSAVSAGLPEGLQCHRAAAEWAGRRM